MDRSDAPARILVVEDDAILHDLIVNVVRRSGHQAVSAYNGEDALRILRDPDQRIDWLLTDIRLPGVIDGWVVGSEFTLTHPRQPVIYMSEVVQDSASRRAANSIFLPKPVDVSDLVATFTRLKANDGNARS
jgi:two-component system, OmpR family, response regulator